MLFQGVKLLFTNRRLTLIQVFPAMWIWAAMLDLKGHVLHGNSFHVVHGPVVIPVVLAVAAVTAASFFLNAVFAFAIAEPGPPRIRPAFARARSSLTVVLGSGAAVGLCLGMSTMVFVRWGQWWFAISLSIVIAVMMICYVAVPARLIGVKTTHSKRDKLALAGGGRRDRSRGLHPALHPGPHRATHARLTGAVHPGHPRPGPRRNIGSRRHRRGQGSQDERQAPPRP